MTDKLTTLITCLPAMLMAWFFCGICTAEEKPIQRIEPKTLNRMMENQEPLMLVNSNSHIECLDSRIPGSVCIPCDDAKERSGLLLRSKEMKIIFYVGNADEKSCKIIDEAIHQGFRKIYILRGGLPAWKRAGYDSESVQRIPRMASTAIKPKDVLSWQKQLRNSLILDVRSPELFGQQHINGALNIPMSFIHLRYKEIPQDYPLLIVDEEGGRSYLVASYLARRGFSNVRRLAGGMTAWASFIKRGSP